MTGSAAAFPTGVIVRKLILTFVGMLLLAAGITLMFESMRAVMDVGGACASGGAYEIRQPCPDGTWLMFVGIFAGLIGTGLVVAGGYRGGPKLWTLAWPALFLALGWNFLEYGLDPPPPASGIVWGWIICAVVFLAMGGIPLLFLCWNARAVFWGTASDDRVAPIPYPGSTVTSWQSRSTATSAPSPSSAPTPSRTTASPTPTAPATSAPPSDDLVDDLERLATLHREGQLTDDEYSRAKDARLAEEAHP